MKTTLLAAAALAAPLVLISATVAQAAPVHGRTTMDVTCAGQVLTVTTAGGHDGNNWGAAQVSGDGHLVLAGLEYSVYDDTAGVSLDDEVLSHGKAHEQQSTVTCVVASQQAVLGEVVDPAFVYPARTAPTDLVTMSVHAVVVAVP
jgi:hypothetical protein